jgi:NAD(P)-dependent dehydrogenase (short-subunit alcohol dehydrogenase family)
MVRPIVAYDARKGRDPNPLNRLGTPREIASLIAYLVTDGAGYITGTTVSIDGGELLSAPTM